jgi:hypothetical protein
VKVVRNDVVPILKKQTGFLEILPLFPETQTVKMVTITLWAEKRDADRYERETYSKGGRDSQAISNHTRHLQALQPGQFQLRALRGALTA